MSAEPSSGPPSYRGAGVTSTAPSSLRWGSGAASGTAGVDSIAAGRGTLVLTTWSLSFATIKTVAVRATTAMMAATSNARRWM